MALLVQQRNILRRGRRGDACQIRVNILEILIGNHLFRKGRHAAGGMTHVGNQSSIGNRVWREFGPRAASLSLITVASVTTEFHELTLAVFRIGGRPSLRGERCGGEQHGQNEVSRHIGFFHEDPLAGLRDDIDEIRIAALHHVNSAADGRA